MPLEAAVIMYKEKTLLICRIDNSEYARNGDYAPSRLEAQVEAAQFLASSRRAANVENSIGLMYSNPATLLVSLTCSDPGRYSAALSSLFIGPAHASPFESSLRIASLALKHRQNGNQKARIIAFLASPLQEPVDSEFLKNLKKSGVAVNFISIGSESIPHNRPFIQEILAALDDSASTVTEVEPTTFSLNEVLRTIPELTGQESGAAASGGDFYGGVDPELDPELALALKLSLEEEQARLAREQAQKNPSASQQKANEEEDEDEELQKAIQMSMQN